MTTRLRVEKTLTANQNPIISMLLVAEEVKRQEEAI
jgi:hypothetical protein